MEHRNYPIDRVLEYVENISITALKFVPKNEEIFNEHFPEESIYPGSMILNSVISALELFLNMQGHRLELSRFKLKSAKFKKKCGSGDAIKIAINSTSGRFDYDEFKFEVSEFFNEDILCIGKIILKKR